MHALRGETQMALDWIERAYEAGWRFPFLETMVHYASLRPEPRFRAVVTRVQGDVAAMRARLELEQSGRTTLTTTIREKPRADIGQSLR